MLQGQQIHGMPLREEINPVAFKHDVFDDDVLFADEDESVAEAALEGPYLSDNRIDTDSIIVLTARLAQVLAEEGDLLAEMRVKEIEPLQREKILLVEALEKQKRFIERNPHLLEELADEECLELAQIIEIFQSVLRENHRRLLIAKEVNRKVVEAISDVVSESAQNGLYDKTGLKETAQIASLSVALDKRI